MLHKVCGAHLSKSAEYPHICTVLATHFSVRLLLALGCEMVNKSSFAAKGLRMWS